MCKINKKVLYSFLVFIGLNASDKSPRSDTSSSSSDSDFDQLTSDDFPDYPLNASDKSPRSDTSSSSSDSDTSDKNHIIWPSDDDSSSCSTSSTSDVKKEQLDISKIFSYLLNHYKDQKLFNKNKSKDDKKLTEEKIKNYEKYYEKLLSLEYSLNDYDLSKIISDLEEIKYLNSHQISELNDKIKSKIKLKNEIMANIMSKLKELLKDDISLYKNRFFRLIDSVLRSKDQKITDFFCGKENFETINDPNFPKDFRNLIARYKLITRDQTNTQIINQTNPQMIPEIIFAIKKLDPEIYPNNIKKYIISIKNSSNRYLSEDDEKKVFDRIDSTPADPDFNGNPFPPELKELIDQYKDISKEINTQKIAYYKEIFDIRTF